MDPITALSLASNVLQFIDFGLKLASALNEQRQGSNTVANLDYLELANGLKAISEPLSMINNKNGRVDQRPLNDEDEVN